jgi:DNA-binding beta-propeller fold protein YncE
MLRTALDIGFVSLALGLLTGAVSGQAQPDNTYWVYVAAESADLVHLVRFGPDGAEVERTIPVGESAVETEGPHGLRISPDGRYLYMTTGHGIPDGKLWKFATGADTLVAAPILLGYFPATLDLTPDGLYAFIVNFNLHGEMVPSTVSVVYTPSMMEVTQTETCTMPHGNRMSPDGTSTYSACMMDDQIVELDTQTFEVARRFDVAKGHEGGWSTDHAGSMDMDSMDPTCSPTWAQVNPAGTLLYVACNRGDEILEISVADWTLVRKFPTGRGPYNLAITPNGSTLIASLKQGGAVEFFDLASGTSRGIVQSTTTVTHGVEVSPDSRYAFISVEGVGAEPGKVDIIDLGTLELVDSVPVGQQAGGIAFWKMDEGGT